MQPAQYHPHNHSNIDLRFIRKHTRVQPMEMFHPLNWIEPGVDNGKVTEATMWEGQKEADLLRTRCLSHQNSHISRGVTDINGPGCKYMPKIDICWMFERERAYPVSVLSFRYEKLY